jgi:hypothetical protein
MLLYADDILLLARNPFDIEKYHRILKYFCISSAMIMNTDKTKIMIIKSRHVIYPKFVYDN